MDDQVILELRKNQKQVQSLSSFIKCKVCTYCNISFETQKLLREHVLLSHQSTVNHCDKCQNYFSSEKALMKHKCYECSMCGKITNHKYRFIKHLRTHAYVKEKALLNGYKQPDKFNCNHCSKSYSGNFFLLFPNPHFCESGSS